MRRTSYSIRQILSPDQEFLWEMLYQSLHVPQGQPPLPRDVVNHPDMAKYVKNWGRPGDLGFVAISLGGNRPIGAAWLRLLTGSEKGYGYVDDETPELAIAVLPEYRGQGVGSDLLGHLLESASSKTIYPSVCLSVSSDNAALHLYERMGFERVSVNGNSVIMIRSLKAG